MIDTILGIDIGGTTVKALVVDPVGAVVARGVTLTGRGDHAVKQVLGLASHLVHEAEQLGATVVAVGAIAPGVMDDTGSRISFASNLEWHDLALSALLSGRVGAPTALANDATSAGIAEGRLGAARGCRDYVHIALGTGVGASIVVDGRVLHGSTGAAGEIGHTSVVWNGELCPCGRFGCVDAYAAAGGLVRRYELLGGDPGSSVPQIVARLGADKIANEVWSDAITALARVIATITMTVDPELVVVGGGVAQAGEVLIAPVLAAVARELVWKPSPRIEQSTLGEMAGLAGALLVATSALDGRQQARWTLEQLPSMAMGGLTSPQ